MRQSTIGLAWITLVCGVGASCGRGGLQAGGSLEPGLPTDESVMDEASAVAGDDVWGEASAGTPIGGWCDLGPTGRPAAMAVIDHNLVIVDREGGTKAIHQFPESFDHFWIKPQDNRVAVVAYPRGVYGQVEPNPLQILVTDLDGKIVWSHATQTLRGNVSDVFVGVGDTVALSGPINDVVVRLASGQVVQLTNHVRPRAAPDAAGMMPGSLTNDNDGFGFINGSTGAFVPLSFARAKRDYGVDIRPVLVDRQWVYLREQNHRIHLVVESANKATTYAQVFANTRRAHLLRSGQRVVVVFDGWPQALWDAADQSLTPLHTGSEIFAERTTTQVFGDHAVVTSGGLLRFVIDLNNRTVTHYGPIALTAEPETFASAMRVVASGNGRFILGTDSVHPFWRLDLQTLKLEPVSIENGSYAPITQARYCAGEPRILDDGRIVVGLKGDGSGGLFVGDPQTQSWDRVGSPLRMVEAIKFDQLADGFMIRGETFEYTYCPYTETEILSGQWGPPVDKDVLSGPSLQVVLPNQSPQIYDAETRFHNFHPTGACALDSDGQIHDFRSRQIKSLGNLRRFVWL